MTKSSRRKQKQERDRRNWIVAAGIVIVVIVIVIVVIALRPSGSTAAADVITVTQAAAMRDQGAFVLDVRTSEEWTQGHIPGSTLIPLDELPARTAEVPRDQDVVVVCRTGHRSQQGMEILKSAGFTRVSSMDGGLTAWMAQGYPTQTGP
jgi:rhodanese-related sulfurtransferase